MNYEDRFKTTTKEKIGPLSILIIIAFTLAAIYFAGCLDHDDYEDDRAVFIEVWTEEDEYSISGEPMFIKVVVTNDRKEDFNFEAPDSGPAVELYIKDENGTTVFRSFKIDMTVMEVITPVTFEAMSSKAVINVNWNFTVDNYAEDEFAEDPLEGTAVFPGTYSLQAVLSISGVEPWFVEYGNAEVTLTI